MRRLRLSERLTLCEEDLGGYGMPPYHLTMEDGERVELTKSEYDNLIKALNPQPSTLSVSDLVKMFWLLRERNFGYR